MLTIDKVLSNQRCILSVMGEHAGEAILEIFNRKISDIANYGKTYWLVNSNKLRPNIVNDFCKSVPVYAIFIEPSTAKGATPTKTSDAAKEYSIDKLNWRLLPEEIGPVTGRLSSPTSALIFNNITIRIAGIIDLWNYADYLNSDDPIKFIQGCSTICAINKNMTLHPEKIKSRFRKILGVGKVVEPYCVWLR